MAASEPDNTNPYGFTSRSLIHYLKEILRFLNLFTHLWQVLHFFLPTIEIAQYIFSDIVHLTKNGKDAL